ncbi:PP2C family protein-serine/threonine phosphatase [Nocardioides sp. CPCC 205120]|uniref:PP2C family protein-serine/threonine phosphatase n=1 Tax=Nocardioides sp. CPCC 205120 TaxID=3406462 RepID=UPI003B512C0B
MITSNRARRVATTYVRDGVGRWRSGSSAGQAWVLGVLAAGVACCFVVSLLDYDLMPVAAYLVWLLAGTVLLRFWPLVVHALVCLLAGVTAVLVDGTFGGARTSSLVAMLVAVGLTLLHARRQRTGLPSLVSEGVLVDLRDRLQAQSTVPPLPQGWRAESAMRPAHGVAYAGDFLVAELDEDGRHLEMILVDVCGKGLAAGTQALQFAGALGGLLGALPPVALMSAANAFLLRQGDDETFATAVHVRVDLTTGAYGIVSAGHPPALRYDAASRTWLVDHARGTALGVDHRPELVTSTGTLAAGEGLMFYTDGVIESRDADLDVGLEWLRATSAREIARRGFPGVTRRVVDQVARGDDDRAVLVLHRE